MIKKLLNARYLMAALYLAIAVVIIYFAIQLVRGIGDAEISIGSENTINVTPERIAKVKSIGQWEFLQVTDEVVIDTIRRRPIMADNRLTCIYYGTVRLGINLDNAPADWITNRNDTIEVRLPAPSVLDDRFIDEARTDVFYQNGKWGSYAREQMYGRAVAQMKAFALSPENVAAVRKAAEMRFESLFKSLGAKDVMVTFED